MLDRINANGYLTNTTIAIIVLGAALFFVLRVPVKRVFEWNSVKGRTIVRKYPLYTVWMQAGMFAAVASEAIHYFVGSPGALFGILPLKMAIGVAVLMGGFSGYHIISYLRWKIEVEDDVLLYTPVFGPQQRIPIDGITHVSYTSMTKEDTAEYFGGGKTLFSIDMQGNDGFKYLREVLGPIENFRKYNLFMVGRKRK